MEYLIITILSVISFLFVIRPLNHPAKEKNTTTSSKDLSNLRGIIYHEMELLRLDHELGLIEIEQYQEQIQQCREQLASTVIAESNT